MWNRATLLHFWYSISGLVLGIVCVIIGMILTLRGVTGSSSWTAKFLGLRSEITDAAPGVIFGLLGLFVIWITKFNVQSK